MSDIIHTRTNADGKVITFTEEQMQLVHIWMTAARNEGATEGGESYSQADVERVCGEFLAEVLAALDRVFKWLPHTIGAAFRDVITADLADHGIIERKAAE